MLVVLGSPFGRRKGRGNRIKMSARGGRELSAQGRSWLDSALLHPGYTDIEEMECNCSFPAPLFKLQLESNKNIAVLVTEEKLKDTSALTTEESLHVSWTSFSSVQYQLHDRTGSKIYCKS
ncbi:unnamed protein product [Caretta caretta]